MIYAGLLLDKKVAIDRTKAELLKELRAEYDKVGLKGNLEITDYRVSHSYGDSFDYTYTDKVDGRTLTFSDRLNVESENGGIEIIAEGDDFNESKYSFTAPNIVVKTGMWQQTYVVDKFDQMAQEFKKIEGDGFTFQSVNGSIKGILNIEDNTLVYEDLLAGQQEILNQFEQNKKENLPLAGFYTVDIPHYLQRHVLEINVNFGLLKKDLYDDDEHLQAMFFEKVKQLDYSQFWDGYYSVGFDKRDANGTTGSSISDIIILDIKDGKVQRTFSAY